MTLPYNYEAFGYGLGSDFPIPELTEANLEPTLHVTVSDVRVASRPDRSSWSYVEGPHVYLGWKGVGEFVVEPGQISVHPEPSASLERVRMFLLGAVMGVLLHRAGLLVLHGSAIRSGDGAVVLLAPKWGGKSTTAGALVERGWEPVSDDLVAIDFSESELRVRPAFPQLKLWPDSLQALGKDSAAIPRIHPEFEKRDFRVGGRFGTEPVPLRAVFLLERAAALSIEALDPLAALHAVMGHWYCARFEYETLVSLGLSSQFQGSTKLAHSVDCFRLEQPASLERIGEVAEAVERAL